ncbi:type IV conjugative transfer system pilin TraA [Photobacterium sp. R1]
MSKYSAFLLVLVGTLLALEPAFAADIFAGAKATIKDNTDSNSASYMAMTVAGLSVSAIGGYMTKNWVGAIGGFLTGIVFTNIAMTIVGL